MVSQQQVAEFYDNLVFPSRSSHNAYEQLIPESLRGKRVGDFGCGQSLFQDRMRDLECEAVFLDISPNALKQIDFGEKLHASLLDIPLPDNNMDAIFCIGVVHHIPEMDKALREMVRVLKPRGTLCIGVYADGTVQSRLKNAYDRAGSRLTKSAVWGTSKFLIWIKNRKNGLRYNSADHRKRIEDLLLTPLVRYISAGNYTDVLTERNMEVNSVHRISQMNIIIATKVVTQLHADVQVRKAT